MWGLRPTVLILAAACLATPIVAVGQQHLDNCPITKPYQDGSTLFVPPWPYPQNPGEGDFWYGSDKLWTKLPASGTWQGSPDWFDPPGRHIKQKLAFFRDGYSPASDLQPPRLSILVRRLDETTAQIGFGPPRTAWQDDLEHPFISTDIWFGSVGCWEIQADYADAEITFVVRIAN